jgi:hypothetical protein
MTPAPTHASVIATSLAEPDRFAEIFDRHFATVFRVAEGRVGPDQAPEVVGGRAARDRLTLPPSDPLDDIAPHSANHRAAAPERHAERHSQAGSTIVCRPFRAMAHALRGIVAPTLPR